MIALRHVLLAGLTPALCLGCVAAFGLWYGRATASDHSRFYRSESLTEARARGVLIHLPSVTDSTFQYADQPLEITEAWVEPVTQLQYRWILFGERRVRLPQNRLLVRITHGGADLLSQDVHYLQRDLCLWADGTRLTVDYGDENGTFSVEVGNAVPRTITAAAGTAACGRTGTR
jgi:hypothetical protein